MTHNIGQSAWSQTDPWRHRVTATFSDLFIYILFVVLAVLYTCFGFKGSKRMKLRTDEVSKCTDSNLLLGHIFKCLHELTTCATNSEIGI